ncbi:MAG: tRNA threonylcarbamoyladenosine dehydratase [Firmicutes bacterium ADurb.Bin193]|nr:MAG: tRNA threonylcarbamoyladenosine dehydratase [Firmicutes bacterium ADurb.Bin193]
MQDIFERTSLLLGEDSIKILKSSRVAVFGTGGVGSFAVEALARCGIGSFGLVDGDIVCPSNINRQLIATTKTVGMPKVEVMKKRILEINPDVKVNAFQLFYNKDTESEFDFSEYDYIVDAIDTVSSKILIIVNAKKTGVPVISSMGAGNKLDPTAFTVSDIYKTSVCPLARVMRKELKARGIDSLKAVYSKEPPLKPLSQAEGQKFNTEKELNTGFGAVKRQIPGSVSFVPSVAGLILASEVIKDLCIIKRFGA